MLAPIATQAPPSGQLIGDLWPWLLALVVLVAVGGVAISAVRRWMRSNDSDVLGGFTLANLRELHAKGEMSDDEFKRAEQAMIQQVRAAALGTDTEAKAAHNPRKNREI